MNDKFIRMVGKKYGRLTVIGVDEKDKLICRCDCGNTKSIYASNIKSGRTRSCGCLWKENLQSFKHDLKGQQFGKLVVLEETGIRKDGCIVWKCLCDCGNIHFVNSKVLLRGEVKSCGCLRHDVSNVLGQRFGKLVVIKEIETSNRKRRMW